MTITVAELMTRGVHVMAPDDSLDLAARLMDDLNVGAMPVCQEERLLGIVTDRDIVVRGIARNRPVDRTPVSDVMSQPVRFCFDDQPVNEVLPEMRQAQIRRLPVLDRRRRLVGMLSLADLATKADPQAAAAVLAAVSEPAEPDRPALPQRRVA